MANATMDSIPYSTNITVNGSSRAAYPAATAPHPFLTRTPLRHAPSSDFRQQWRVWLRSQLRCAVYGRS
jgi:hypothetical protein